MSVRTEKYIECDANQCGEQQEYNNNNYIGLSLPSNFNSRNSDRRLFKGRNKSGDFHFCTMECMLTYLENEIYQIEGMFSHE